MNLTCPRCMCEACIKLDLADGETMSCPDCNEEITVSDIESLIEGWSKILPWLRAHPARQEQPECVKVA